jgi:flagellar motor switch/type III secretory pathway protein FliN
MINKLNLSLLLETFEKNQQEHLIIPSSIKHEDITGFFAQSLDCAVRNVTFHVQHPIHHLPKDAFVYCLKADPIDAPVFVGIENPSALFLFSKFFGQKEPFFDKRLQNGALGFIVLKMLKNLDEKPLFPKLGIHVQEFVASKETLHHTTLSVEMEDESFFHLHLYYDESFIKTFNALHNTENQESLNPVYCALKAVIGQTVLPKMEMSKIKKDQVLVLDEAHINLETKKGVATLELFGQKMAQVRFGSNHMKVIDLCTPTPGETMEESHELSSIEEMQMQVKVELSTIKMSLGKLQHLKSGDTLDFETETLGSVFLTVDGQKIAKGELVKIGENIGVLIQETAYDR